MTTKTTAAPLALGYAVAAVAALAGESGIHVTAVTSGGSQAVFFKVNTMGEESFLDKAREAFHRWSEASRPG